MINLRRKAEAFLTGFCAKKSWTGSKRSYQPSHSEGETRKKYSGTERCRPSQLQGSSGSSTTIIAEHKWITDSHVYDLTLSASSITAARSWITNLRWGTAFAIIKDVDPTPPPTSTTIPSLGSDAHLNPVLLISGQYLIEKGVEI